VTVLLDWRRGHWAPRAARCRFCPGWPTHIRDDYGRATHKTCAEEHPIETATPPPEPPKSRTR